MKKIIIIILILLLAFLGVSYLKKKNDTSTLNLTNNIIVGTTSDFPPFSYRDSNNQIVGFDIDIIKEIAKKLNRNIEIKDMSFDSLWPKLKNGDIQVIAAGVSQTPKRSKNALFTSPYLTGNPLMVITLKNSLINKFEDLKYKTIVVNAGHISDIYMSRIPDIILKRVVSVSDTLLLLKNNQADAAIISFQAIKPLLKKIEDKYKTFGIEETNENVSLAITQIFPILFNEIQKSLDELESNGTISALKKKWQII